MGDGVDTVQNFGRDATILINGVTAGDISFEVDLLNGDEDTLIIRYSPTDHIEVYRQLYDGYSQYGIAALRLDDGTEFGLADFAQAIAVGTSGADTITGTSRDDIIEGGAGDDIVDGDGGSDTYLWSLGDGNVGQGALLRLARLFQSATTLIYEERAIALLRLARLFQSATTKIIVFAIVRMLRLARLFQSATTRHSCA